MKDKKNRDFYIFPPWVYWVIALSCGIPYFYDCYNIFKKGWDYSVIHEKDFWATFVGDLSFLFIIGLFLYIYIIEKNKKIKYRLAFLIFYLFLDVVISLLKLNDFYSLPFYILLLIGFYYTGKFEDIEQKNSSRA